MRCSFPKQTNSIKGEHVEPQATPPMSQITIVNAPTSTNIMAQLPNHLIMDIIKLTNQPLCAHRSKYKSVLDSVERQESIDFHLDPVSNPYGSFWEQLENHALDVIEACQSENAAPIHSPGGSTGFDFDLLIEQPDSIFHIWPVYCH